MTFELVPYVSVGPIKFGASTREVRKAMGALPDYVYGGRSLERYGNTSVYYDWEPPHVVAIRNGTTGTEGFLLRGFGPLGMSFAEACQAFGGAGAIVRPRGICNFEYGVTFELKSGQTAQARDYIFTACGPESLWLSKWRMYEIAMKRENGEAKCRELDEWVDHDEWGIALETLVAMAEESPGCLSEDDFALVRQIGRGMDEEFFAWLSEVEMRA